MPVLHPFCALRPTAETAAEVVCVPYDVLSREEAATQAELAFRTAVSSMSAAAIPSPVNPVIPTEQTAPSAADPIGRQPGEGNSFLRVTRAEIDLPDLVDQHDQQVHEQAAKNLAEFISRGVLVRETEPTLYLYREVWRGHVQLGVVGCVNVSDYDNGTIKQHERTLAVKEADRIAHFARVGAHTEPVFLTYPAQQRIDTLLAPLLTTEPLFTVSTVDGTEHSLWPLGADLSARVGELFAQLPAFYIADGHHRSASAAKVGATRTNAGQTDGAQANASGATVSPELAAVSGSETSSASDRAGFSEADRFLAVVIPDRDLTCLPYNRLVKDWGNTNPAAFAAALEQVCHLEPSATAPVLSAPGQFACYFAGQWWRCIFRGEAAPSATDPTANLDVARLQNIVLAPLLGIGDPRTDQRIDFVGGIRGTQALQATVDEGVAAVAFSLYPTQISQVLEVADAGLIMPPKSTWFEPKLASGLFIHEL